MADASFVKLRLANNTRRKTHTQNSTPFTQSLSYLKWHYKPPPGGWTTNPQDGGGGGVGGEAAPAAD